MKINSTNQIPAGSLIYEEGTRPGYILMLLKGKVEVLNRGVYILCNAGSLLGLEQLGGDEVRYTCRAYEDISVYAVSADDDRGLQTLLAANKDYPGIALYNQTRLLIELTKQCKELGKYSRKLYEDTKEFYSDYLSLAQKNGCRAGMLPEVSQLLNFVADIDIDIHKLNLYSEYSKIPYETMKTFYSCSVPLAIDAIMGISGLEESLIENCESMADYIEQTFDIMVGRADYCLYRNIVGLAIDMRNKGADCSPVESMMGSCLEYMKIVKELIQNTARSFCVDEASLLEMKNAYISGGDFRDGSDAAGNVVDSDIAKQVDKLQGSFGQLVAYGSYPEDKAAEFEKLLGEYISLSDRESADEGVRKLRKELTEHFYNLYYKVFLAANGKTNVPKAVELMLDYGYLSEKLLREEQLISLLTIKKSTDTEPCVVYTMREWLEAVYSGKKEPSKNDMGFDYAESLREMRKSQTITEAEEKELLQNRDKKLEYELKNVMVHAIRVVNGQLSTFIPILQEGQFIGDVNKAYISAERINKAVKELTAIDYSVFYREALYVNETAGIEREYEMKNVFPIFIIYPVAGENIIMWQEITGRKRDTEGRFLTPAFSYGNINDMMIKAFGQFRWALCKTIQGTNWNNIQVKSLTSEYSDYIQFYKKNHDLSDERKEKIKLQIQRGRNNLREVFTLDYEVWMKAEASGAIRLNKIVRDMLAMYCPFKAEIRNNLIRQPIFEEGFARNIRERNKKVHELELRYKALEAKGIELPEPLKNTMIFYRDM